MRTEYQAGRRLPPNSTEAADLSNSESRCSSSWVSIVLTRTWIASMSTLATSRSTMPLAMPSAIRSIAMPQSAGVRSCGSLTPTALVSPGASAARPQVRSRTSRAAGTSPSSARRVSRRMIAAAWSGLIASSRARRSSAEGLCGRPGPPGLPGVNRPRPSRGEVVGKSKQCTSWKKRAAWRGTLDGRLEGLRVSRRIAPVDPKR